MYLDGRLYLSPPPFTFGGMDHSPSGVRFVVLKEGHISSWFEPLLGLRKKESLLEFPRCKSELGDTFPCLKWRKDLEGVVYKSGPIVGMNKIFIATQRKGRGVIQALDLETGDEVWTREVLFRIKGRLIMKEGDLYALDVGGVIYGIDPFFGGIIFQHSIDPDIPFRFYCQGGIGIRKDLLFAGCAPYFAGFDLHLAKRLWSIRLGEDHLPTYVSPVLYEDMVLGGGHSGGIKALVSDRGRILWQRGDFLVLSTPLIDNDRIYIVSKEMMLAMDLEDGQTYFKFDLPPGYNSAPPVISDGVIYLADGNGVLHAIEAEDGKVKWRFRTKRAILQLIPYRREGGGIIAEPLIKGDFIYLGGLDGWLYVLDKNTGKRIGGVNLQSPILSPFVYNQGYIYVATYDRGLFAFRVKNNS
jgi:outer membrane protein assembly factor BamB